MIKDLEEYFGRKLKSVELDYNQNCSDCNEKSKYKITELDGSVWHYGNYCCRVG